MRREGFEFSVSPPRVLLREEGGEKLEPLEEVVVEVEDAHGGAVIEVASAPATEGPCLYSQGQKLVTGDGVCNDVTCHGHCKNADKRVLYETLMKDVWPIPAERMALCKGHAWPCLDFHKGQG